MLIGLKSEGFDAERLFIWDELENLVSWPLELNTLYMNLTAKQVLFEKTERIGRSLMHVASWSQNFSKFLFLLLHEFFNLRFYFFGVGLGLL